MELGLVELSLCVFVKRVEFKDLIGVGLAIVLLKVALTEAGSPPTGDLKLAKGVMEVY